MIFIVPLGGAILQKSWSFSTKKKLPLKIIFLKEDEMLIKFVRSIQQKVGMGFLSTDFRKYFRKAILWIEELVQADNEQLLPEKMKTLKSSSTQETRTKSAGALANRFRKIRSVKTCV